MTTSVPTGGWMGPVSRPPLTLISRSAAAVASSWLASRTLTGPPMGMRVCLRRRVGARAPRIVWITKSRFGASSASNSTEAPARTRMRGSAARQVSTVPRIRTLLGRASQANSTTTGVPGCSSVVVGQNAPPMGRSGRRSASNTRRLGRRFALGAHLDRLERSAARIWLRAPPRGEGERAVAETVRAAAITESRVRIMLTRGVGKLDLDPASSDDTQLIVVVMPFQPLPRALYDEGASAAIVSIVRNDPRAIDPAIKSGNYLNNVLALGEARRQGAHEALLCAADGTVAEGATSNEFMVKDCEVRTPGLDVVIL